MALSDADGPVLRHVGLGLVVSLCLVPGIAYGQPAKEVHEQYQFWGSLNSTTRITDRFGAIADAGTSTT
jgi:hypothetical protein